MKYSDKFTELKKTGEGAFIPFVVLGDPDVETSFEIIKTLVDNGADMLELGIAFSDPIADGPTIQAADSRVLARRVKVDDVINLIKKVRAYTDIPIGLLVYYNLIHYRGLERFYSDVKGAGVDGILAADLSLEESEDAINAARKHELDQIFLIAQTTPNVRAQKILKSASGFVYLVSLLGVTGARSELEKGTIELVERVRALTSLPLCVGFGISEPKHVRAVMKAGADGVIVGSAIEKIIENNLNNKKRMLDDIADYVRGMKEATKNI